MFEIDATRFKKTYKFCDMKKEEKWKISLARKMTVVKQGSLQLQSMDADENFLSYNKFHQIIDSKTT